MLLRSIGRKVNQMPLPYRTKHGAGGSAFSLTAPVLAFASATDPDSDNTQDLDADIAVALGSNVIRLVGTFGSATVSAPYDVDTTGTDGDLDQNIPFTTGAITDGVCSFKCRIETAGGSALSDWSNTVSKTIDATAPTISTASTANCAENATLSISLAANETVSWTLTGGADQARFEISGTTLRWASNGTKDYETPNDADTNNTYVAQVTATDNAGNATNKTITVTVTNVDEVAPTLSSATDVKTGQTTADVGVDTNEANGTLYSVVTTSSTSPTAAQVKTGKDNSGVTATYAANQVISSTGTKGFSVTGLTAATAYTAHFMHEDALGNQSTVVKGDGFTTDSASFLPSDIASLWTWIDPAVNSFQAIAGTTAATADADPVGYLTDRSGNSRHWIAAADNTTRPVLKTNIINSLPVIRFTPASLTVTYGSNMSALTAGEIFIVIKKNNDPASNAGIWVMGTAGSQDHIPYTDGTVYCGALSTVRNNCGNPTPSLASAFRLWDIWSASSDYAFEIDGSAFFSTATNTFGGAAAPNIGKGIIGGALYAEMDVAEVCIFSAKLSAGDRTSMKSYIATKYGLTIA